MQVPHARQTHCLKTRGTVPRLVCLVQDKVQLSGDLRYRPIHLWKTVVEIVLLTSVWVIIGPNASVVAVENSISGESCFIRK